MKKLIFQINLLLEAAVLWPWTDPPVSPSACINQQHLNPYPTRVQDGQASLAYELTNRSVIKDNISKAIHVPAQQGLGLTRQSPIQDWPAGQSWS